MGWNVWGNSWGDQETAVLLLVGLGFELLQCLHQEWFQAYFGKAIAKLTLSDNTSIQQINGNECATVSRRLGLLVEEALSKI